MTMNSRDIAYWRMHNLGLMEARFKAPEEVVRWLGAVQSQDYGPAKWSVASRIPGGNDAAVERAYASGAILRTHVLRPTWHFVLPEDIRWILDLTAPRVHAANAHMYRQSGLDADILKRSLSVLTKVLEGGNHLTRKEVGAVLEQGGISTEGFRLTYIIMSAELDGVICSGVPKGRQHTYALLHERAPRARSLTHDEALAELTLRYFTSHGPATAKDFSAWASLRVADVKKGLDMAGDRLEHMVVEGLSYWFAPSSPCKKPEPPMIQLLQGYDEYFSGYRESKHLVDESGVGRATSGDRPIFNNAVILDSQVAGHWKRNTKSDSVIIDAALFAPFDEAQSRKLQSAADEFARFLGLTTAEVRTQTLSRA